MRSTSSGNRTMYSPFRENITTIVNSSATSVSGLIRGMKFRSYQVSPFSPNQQCTRQHPGQEWNSQIDENALAICAMETLTTAPCRPNLAGSTVMNIHA